MKRLSLILLLFFTGASAQESKPANVTAFANRAVTLVATHSFRAPAVTVLDTDRPLTRRGHWSVRRLSTSGCDPRALACVAVLNTFTDDVACEWTV